MMKDPEIDLNAYALGEATPAERVAAEAFLAVTPEAREEFERLQFALTALATVREEEMPRRIAFVSDPVFEPTLWQRLWSSTSGLAFAGACVLAFAITAHGFLMRPVVAVAPSVSAAGISQADVDRVVNAAVNRAVNRAVAAVEAKTEARVRNEVAVAVAKTEKRFSQELQMMSATVQENETIIRKQLNRMYVTNAGLSIDGGRP